MSITDELRDYIASKCGRLHGARCSGYGKLLKIADRIDERYRRDMATAQQVGINEGEDAAMRDGWVRLPVDKDGVPIRVGDEVEFFNGNHDHVKLLALRESGWSVNYLEWNPASLRHHQPDSWERIIEDAISESGWEQPKDYEIYYEDSKETRDRFVAELVERCRRLAGEAQ